MIRHDAVHQEVSVALRALKRDGLDDDCRHLRVLKGGTSIQCVRRDVPDRPGYGVGGMIKSDPFAYGASRHTGIVSAHRARRDVVASIKPGEPPGTTS
jgi:hypothetical protein